ncbi:MAG: hypothetical protein AMXMBFR53_45150 [Gemmatimonadota bacterium]
MPALHLAARDGVTPRGSIVAGARALAALAFAFPAGVPTAPAAAQEVAPPAASPDLVIPDVAATHALSLYRRVEAEVHAALLAEGGEAREAHLAAAEQVARHLVEADPADADAQYWLAVALGIRTEHSGPFQKLTTGREVFFTAARVLELDSLHAGGHEMMGRLHAAVMRLPWVVRKLALSLGMGQALGEASWRRAEDHYARARDLDAGAIAPRLELAKLYVQQEREEEARPVLVETARLPARSEVDRRMLAEAREILAGLSAAPPSHP